jgi:phospholipase/carboxylesterase
MARHTLSRSDLSTAIYSNAWRLLTRFVIDGGLQGRPSFYISHGTRDQILPIDRCGRRIAAELKSRGYEVTFREFEGRHEIPRDVMLEGLRWLRS